MNNDLFARALRGERMGRAERDQIQYAYDAARWECCWTQVSSCPDQWVLSCSETEHEGIPAMLIWPDRMTA